MYTLGSAEPRSFSRGKRGIAGTLVFTSFDRDALIAALKENAVNSATFQRIGGELNMHPISIDEWDKKMTDQIGLAGDNIASSNPENVTKKVAVITDPHYGDEVPPFDITISFANEFGQEAYMVIYGVQLMNEGSGYSIDSITAEKACTFLARRIDPMVPVED